MPLLDDFPRARYDIPFFAARFLGITLHPGQIRVTDAVIQRNNTGWRPRYTDVTVSSGNRAGKTLIMSIVIFHSCLFKTNMRPPDLDNDASIRQWMMNTYDWYHFGIQQEVAELVFSEIVRILEGRHEAQHGKGCPLTDELGSDVCVYSKKYRGDYPWIVFSEMLGGAEIHFRTTTEKAVGSLGKDMAGVSMDECGFEANLDFIVGEVFHLRRLSTGGQLFLISTPSEGFTAFADEWAKGDPDNPLRRASHISLRLSTRENIGFGIDQAVFDVAIADMAASLIPQNIDGYFIQGTKAFFNAQSVDKCFSDDLEERELAIDKHQYVQGIDPALVFDATWSIVLDVTDRSHIRGVSAQRLQGHQQTINVVALAHDQHLAFSDAKRLITCQTALDITGMGGKLFREMLGGIPGLRGVEFGGQAKTKLRLLMDVKSMIEQGKIRFPRSGIWLELRRQLLAYRLQDRKLQQDAVMALAVAVKQAIRLPEGPAASSLDFDYFGAANRGLSDEERLWQSLGRRGVVSKINVT